MVAQSVIEVYIELSVSSWRSVPFCLLFLVAIMSSKDLKPLGVPFFPNIFFKNQFCTKPVWPSNINLSGKTAIITGANQGLGFECADQLLSFGLSRLIIAVRSPAKGEAAAKILRKHKAVVDVYELDMSSYASIQSFAARLDHVDIAILNAGTNQMKFNLVEGHEETFQVNYLSTVLLCILLLPIADRISIVSSGLAFTAKFNNRSACPLIPSFDNPDFDGLEQYNVSKLLSLLFLYKVPEYISAERCIVNVVDPGFIKGTNLLRDWSFVASAAFAPFEKIAGRTIKVGASAYVDAVAVKGKESHGSFLMSWRISP